MSELTEKDLYLYHHDVDMIVTHFTLGEIAEEILSLELILPTVKDGQARQFLQKKEKSYRFAYDCAIAYYSGDYTPTNYLAQRIGYELEQIRGKVAYCLNKIQELTTIRKKKRGLAVE